MVDKPSKDYGSVSTSRPSPLPLQIEDPSIRGASWDQLIQQRGIRFLHKISAPCPNIKRVNDNNHDPDCTLCDRSGILFIQTKEIFGVFGSNTLQKIFETQGEWEIGTAVITFPAKYIDGLEADFAYNDQLECPDFQIRIADLKEYRPTSDNRQKLRYPIVKVQNITSVRSNVLFTFTEGTDFKITSGEIEWLITPAFNATTLIGEVLSITYTANPVYNVLSVIHELRVTQEYDIATGTKVARRLPQQIQVRRDFLNNSSNEVNA